MSKSAAWANAVLDAEFNGAASGTATIGAVTLTYPLRGQFLSTVSTDTTQGTPLGSPVSLAGAFGTAASGKSKSNTVAIQLASAPAGTWADFEVIDSSGTPVRLNFKGTPSLAKTVNAGDTLVIPIGQLTGSES